VRAGGRISGAGVCWPHDGQGPGRAVARPGCPEWTWAGDESLVFVIWVSLDPVPVWGIVLSSRVFPPVLPMAAFLQPLSCSVSLFRLFGTLQVLWSLRSYVGLFPVLSPWSPTFPGSFSSLSGDHFWLSVIFACGVPVVGIPCSLFPCCGALGA